jgi:general secretion pathway protein B
MSLILEALRKSEAERQAASLPALIRSETAARVLRRRWPGWLGWLPLVLLAGLGIGWWGPRWLAQERSDPAPPAANTLLDAPADASTPPPNARARALVQQAQPTLVDPAPKAPAPAPERIAPDPAPPPAVAPTLPPAAAAQTASTSPPDAVPDAVSLALMPSAQRQQLPALKLSVHVFNPDPARRFAIVDGRRVQEGDALGATVRVRQIRREGLLLHIDGRDWLLEAVR